ncbi:RTX toxins and related Ca2+-binding proteins [Algibacter lectus]|uniref:RTX toxins and related Ca2+-binding proteins n=2 Tax=Algibacter lectus TaxID=221126 RepID=A0A090WPV4_9FLAO|nr:RTX toxins and related Ca2+-binding proteins [Algibacter lectus]
MLGDLDNDGNKELAVGAFMSDDGKGAIWILSLDSTTYNVVSKTKITEGLNGFTDELVTDINPNGTFGANLGHAMCAPGDIDGDGIADLVTGANQQYEGWGGYVLYLNADKTVKSFDRINNTEGGFNLSLEAEGVFLVQFLMEVI